MRKSFDTLAALVTERMKRAVITGDLFLFVGRDRRRAKVPYFDGTGMCLLAKHLEKGLFSAAWKRAKSQRGAGRPGWSWRPTPSAIAFSTAAPLQPPAKFWETIQALCCDGYSAYESLRKRGGRFEIAHCSAHVRQIRRGARVRTRPRWRSTRPHR